MLSLSPSFRLHSTLLYPSFTRLVKQHAKWRVEGSSLNKERLHTDPAFANSLRIADECGGRSKAAKFPGRVLYPLDPVRVGNWQVPFSEITAG